GMIRWRLQVRSWRFIMRLMHSHDFSDTFFDLDFDRCLGDTDWIQPVLEEVILRETGIRPEKLHAVRAEIEAVGRTFDTIHQVHVLLEEAGSHVAWSQIRGRLLEDAREHNLLLPHARELLDILRSRQILH